MAILFIFYQIDKCINLTYTSSKRQKHRSFKRAIQHGKIGGLFMPHATIELNCSLEEKTGDHTVTEEKMTALLKLAYDELKEDLEEKHYTNLTEEGDTVEIKEGMDPTVTSNILVWSHTGETSNSEIILKKNMEMICESFNERIPKYFNDFLVKLNLEKSYSKIYISAEEIDCQAEEEFDGDGGYRDE